MGLEGAMPSVQEIQEIRQEVGRRVAELEAEEVDVGDVARINNDDKYVAKFFRHVFDHPGELFCPVMLVRLRSELHYRPGSGRINDLIGRAGKHQGGDKY